MIGKLLIALVLFIVLTGTFFGVSLAMYINKRKCDEHTTFNLVMMIVSAILLLLNLIALIVVLIMFIVRRVKRRRRSVGTVRSTKEKGYRRVKEDVFKSILNVEEVEERKVDHGGSDGGVDEGLKEDGNVNSVSDEEVEQMYRELEKEQRAEEQFSDEELKLLEQIEMLEEAEKRNV